VLGGCAYIAAGFSAQQVHSGNLIIHLLPSGVFLEIVMACIEAAAVGEPAGVCVLANRCSRGLSR
jgi:hypothetical protein